MKTYRIKVRQVYIETMFVEAENEIQAETLAHANINSFDVEDEFTSEWVIESIEEL